MDDAIRTEDIKAYIQRRRAYLSTRRDAAETPADKGKAIGMLQALADFEGMARQLQVTPASSATITASPLNVPETCDDLASQLLSVLGIAGARLEDFRDDARQNRAIARHPEKKQWIMVLGQLVRNKALVDAVLDHLGARVRGLPAGDSTAPVRASARNGSTCPFCGKTYKYAKALETHVTWCPKKSIP